MDFDFERAEDQQVEQAGEKHTILSFRAERGISLFLSFSQREIPRSARNDKIKYFFRELGILRETKARSILVQGMTRLDQGGVAQFLYRED